MHDSVSAFLLKPFFRRAPSCFFTPAAADCLRQTHFAPGTTPPSATGAAYAAGSRRPPPVETSTPLAVDRATSSAANPRFVSTTQTPVPLAFAAADSAQSQDGSFPRSAASSATASRPRHTRLREEPRRAVVIQPRSVVLGIPCRPPA